MHMPPGESVVLTPAAPLDWSSITPEQPLPTPSHRRPVALYPESNIDGSVRSTPLPASPRWRSVPSCETVPRTDGSLRSASTRTRPIMDTPDRPAPPTVIDATVERERIAALEKLRQRLESALDTTPAGLEFAAMARQLRETVNAIADARNRIYEALLDEEPEAGDR